MKIRMSDGRVREVPVRGTLTGLQVEAVCFTQHDLNELLSMNDSDMRGFLHLFAARFTPCSETAGGFGVAA